MKSILLHIQTDPGLASRLDFAIDLAQATGAHIRCAQITPFDRFVGIDTFGGVHVSEVMLEELREAEQLERARVETRLAQEGLSWDWTSQDGDIAHMLMALGRLSDAIIVSRADLGGNVLTRPDDIVSDVAIHSRTPVFSVPHDRGYFEAGRAVAIAWNGSYEAAHALRSAVPLLRLAGAVHLIEVGQPDEDFPALLAAAYLQRHGVTATLTAVEPSTGGIGQALRDAASAVDAGYLVMGAYGHSRLREAILGGVTRDLIAHAPLPLFLAH